MTETALESGPFGNVVRGFSLVQGQNRTTLKGRTTTVYGMHECPDFISFPKTPPLKARGA